MSEPDPEKITDSQMNIGRVARYAQSQKRDWGLYLFFRILRQREITTPQAVERALGGITPAAPESSPDGSAVDRLVAGYSSPLLMMDLSPDDAETGMVAEAATDDATEPVDEELPRPNAGEINEKSLAQLVEARPATRFFQWLKLLSTGDWKDTDGNVSGVAANGKAKKTSELVSELQSILSGHLHDREKAERIAKLLIVNIQKSPADIGFLTAIFDALEETGKALANQPVVATLAFQMLAHAFEGVAKNPQFAIELLKAFGDNPAEAGANALKGRLPLTMVYEFLRYFAGRGDGAGSDDGVDRNELSVTLLRPECGSGDGQDGSGQERGERKGRYDRSPVNISFTHSGLEAMQLIDPETLESFPTAFREGMAARAEHLGDTGPSAPSELGGGTWITRYPWSPGHGLQFRAQSERKALAQSARRCSQLQRVSRRPRQDAPPVPAHPACRIRD